ncbi:GNAT family N-acetyltransferase [Mycolicibacterium canariasense]|nr:GNAT family N-acetyltransferase [Mycolicibacterium canariasense]ORV10653.1 hypothetical protein AWB94_06885 [Mycolicibacterium canariasense]
MVRQLNADDFDAVVELADTLSDEERYLRFFTLHPSHIADWAKSLTDPPAGAIALGAYDHGELVGVANYIPTTEPHRAEVAVLVARYQHDRGVGTALLGRLIGIARQSGVRHFVAEVLAENNAMLRLLTESHLPISIQRCESVLNVDVDLDLITQDQ